MPREQSLASQLSTLIVEVLVKARLPQEAILGGAIEHTNLPWQIPPLIAEATLFDVPFSDFLGSVTYLNADQLYTLWSDALGLLRNKPDKVVTPDGYRAVSYAIPHVRHTERQIHLSMPEGYPHGVTDLAGITLSLECAQLLRHNTKLASFVSDDDNHYAVLPDGREVGVKDGLPTLYAEIWDIPVEGMVQEILRTPRGSVWEGCDYNIISKVRSVTTSYGEALPDADAVDWALQTLRVINGHVELLAAVRKMNTVSYTRKMRFALLEDAVKVSRQASLTDRQRLATLRAILVPEVLSSGQFSKTIFPYTRKPTVMLAAKVLARIQASVDSLLENEKRLYANPVKELSK